MDDDNDGIDDDSDTCPTSQVIGVMNNSVDVDGDGCHDLLEDNDQDNDGVLNVDTCENTRKEELLMRLDVTSTQTTI